MPESPNPPKGGDNSRIIDDKKTKKDKPKKDKKDK